MKQRNWLTIAFVLLFTLLGSTLSIFAQGPETDVRLGEPLKMPEKVTSQPISPMTPIRRGGLTVNPQNRQESLNFYQTNYLPSEKAEIGWTGNHDSCNAGTTSQAFRDAITLRINYFRAMAGVPADITLNETYNSKAQQAALMMSVNGQLDHFPPSDWTCYTEEGKEAAGKSNLAGVSGPNAITGYIKDSGASNYFLGHRRWILYPQTQQMGSGDVPSASPHMESNALWVLDSDSSATRPNTREEYVAWPPPGYVPYQVVFARWSFSYPNADFSNAAVSMTSSGSNIPVEPHQILDGYGENTLVWIPMGLADGAAWPQPTTDTTYMVKVSNVLIDGTPRTFEYEVTVFDSTGPTPTPNPNSTSTPTPTSTPIATSSPTATSAPGETSTPVPTASPTATSSASSSIEWQGGTSNDWHTASNWVPNGVPTVNDDVLIPDMANDPVIQSADVAVNSLTLNAGAVLDLTSRTLTVEERLTNNGTLKQTQEVTLGSTTNFLRITNQAGNQTTYYGVVMTPTDISNSAQRHPVMRWPAENPPQIKIDTPVDNSSKPSLENAPVDNHRHSPTTEWAFHKSSDNLHPDGNEQQVVWLMNRARTNPTEEGRWLATTTESDVAGARDFFNVNIEVLQQEFAGYDAKPPAAFDVRLYNAAKAHSDDLIARDAQDHEGQSQRITDAGFSYSNYRGNVFSYAKSALNAHGGWNIDWGSGTPDGMQTSRGHRKAIMSIDGDYTNVGIALVSETDSNTQVGPLVGTGNYVHAGNGSDHYNRFIVGTVWKDKDGDSMYDPGEGVAGVTVKPDSGTYYAVTANSGGYAIPLTASGTYQVTFSGAANTVKSVTVGNESVLLDYLVPGQEANQAPTDITLTGNSVTEGRPIGSTVGTFTTTDSNASDTHTYSLVAGTGDDHNSSFTIEGSTLKTAAVFDYNTQNSYNIRVQTNDGRGGTFSKAFTISVREAVPVSVTLSISGNQFCPDRTTGVKRCFEINHSTNTVKGMVRFYFNEAERNEYNLNELQAWRNNSGTWSRELGPYTHGGTGNAQYVEAQNINSLSSFALDSSPADSRKVLYLPVVLSR